MIRRLRRVAPIGALLVTLPACDSWVAYHARVADPTGSPLPGVTTRFEPGRRYGEPIIASASDSTGCIEEGRTVAAGKYSVDFVKEGYKPGTVVLTTMQYHALLVTLAPVESTSSSEVREVTENGLPCPGPTPQSTAIP